MPESQAGSEQPSKAPWEEGFWGKVIDKPEPVAPPKPKALLPWEAGFWDGRTQTKKPPSQPLESKTKESMKRVTVERATMVVTPEEQAKRDAEAKNLPTLVFRTDEESQDYVQASIRELEVEMSRKIPESIRKIYEKELQTLKGKLNASQR